MLSWTPNHTAEATGISCASVCTPVNEVAYVPGSADATKPYEAGFDTSPRYLHLGIIHFVPECLCFRFESKGRSWLRGNPIYRSS
jgi:hypothetical protein